MIGYRGRRSCSYTIVFAADVAVPLGNPDVFPFDTLPKTLLEYDEWTSLLRPAAEASSWSNFSIYSDDLDDVEELSWR